MLALISALAELALALWQIVKVLGVVSAVGALIFILFVPGGATKIGGLLANIVNGAWLVVIDVADTVLPVVEPTLENFYSAFKKVESAPLGLIPQEMLDAFGALASSAWTELEAAITAAAAANPNDPDVVAKAAIEKAYSFGFESWLTTAVFESIFPEKLNVLNGIGPVLATMSGFERVSASIRDPIIDAAIRVPAEYAAEGKYKPRYPREIDAVTWHARRLLNDADLKEIFGVSGLKSKYETPYVASAYRAVSPFFLASALVDAPYDETAVNSAIEFMGIRPADVPIMQAALKNRSLQTQRNQYISAVMTAWERGTIDDATAANDLSQQGLQSDAINLIQLAVATRKLEQLAEIYRKSVSADYVNGLITDAQYVPALEAIGIAAADANAHYAVDSARVKGRALKAAERAAEKAAAATMRLSIQAANLSYQRGQIDDAGLTAALTAAGVPLQNVAIMVEIQSLRKKRPLQFVYGLWLDRSAATLMREQVIALGEQFKKSLITEAAARAQLTTWQIPTINQDALIADWGAIAKTLIQPV